MTESEAKQKWCPMVRLAWKNETDGGAITANRWGSGDPLMGAMCIGSACMMWCTTIGHRAHNNGIKITYTELPPGEREGYCGLAVKP